jgi:hypothetical protein
MNSPLRTETFYAVKKEGILVDLKKKAKQAK